MSHEKALEYLSGAFDGIPNADELLQLVELEFIRKDALQNSQNKVCICPCRRDMTSSVCLVPNTPLGSLPAVDL